MKKLLSIVLSICIIVSALGAMPAMASTVSSGGSSGSVSAGSGNSSGGSGGGGGSSSGGSSDSTATGYAVDVCMNLHSNKVLESNGKFYSGDVEVNGYVSVLTDTEVDVHTVMAYYNDNGTLLDISMETKTISSLNGEVHASLSEVNHAGIVRCMLIDAKTLSPLCPAKQYRVHSDTMTVDFGAIDYASQTSLEHSENFVIGVYQSDDAYNSTEINISSEVEVYVNGELLHVDADLLDYDGYTGMVEFAEISNDKYVDTINITIYEYGIVDEVIADKERITFVDGNKVTFDSDDPYQIVDIFDANGNIITLDDINSGDVLAMVVCELKEGYNVPVGAKVFTNKIIIYNLGDTSFEGTVTGMSASNMKLYIDNVAYKSVQSYATSDSWSDFLNEAPLGRNGKFYKDMDGRIIGAELYRDCTYGFILQSELNSYGFDEQYRIKMLTENEGIVEYNVDTACVINDNYCGDIYSQGQYLTFDAYIASGESYNDDAYARIVQYYTNSNGEIDDIAFLDDIYFVKPRDGAYYAPTGSMWGVTLTDDIIMFNVSGDNVDDMCRITKDNLYDEAEYEGYIIQDSYSDNYNIFIIYSGTHFKDKTDTEESADTNIGFVLSTRSFTSSLDECYQVALLTETESIVTYNVAHKCTIDGYRYTTEEQGDYFDIPTYSNTAADADARIIEYQLNTNGEISNISFIENSDTICSFDGKYENGTLDGYDVSYKAVIFDLTGGDAMNGKTVARSDLLEYSKYTGVATYIDINNKYNIVVLTDFVPCFNPSAALKVVEKTETVDFEGESAVKVSYYTDGESTLREAYITYQSECIGSVYDYTDMTKGSMFDAVVDEQGEVMIYTVLMVINPDTFEFEYEGLTETSKIAYSDDFPEEAGDGVEFICGYIVDIYRTEAMVGDRWVDTSSYAAQYAYRTGTADPQIYAGEWLVDMIDSYYNGEAYLAFVKQYHGETTDIISISDMKNVTEEQAKQLLYSTVN